MATHPVLMELRPTPTRIGAFFAEALALLFNALPSASWQGLLPTENCWDVPDGLEYCRGIVDRWGF